MPSILDSAQLVFTDKNAPAKIALASLIPFTIYNILELTFPIPPMYMPITIIILSLVLYGYLVQTLKNSIAEKNYILPNLNIFKALWLGIKGAISSGVFLLPIYLMHTKVIENFTYPVAEDWRTGLALALTWLFTAILYLFSASFLFTSIIFYSKNLKIGEGLSLKKILRNFHEIVVYLAGSILLLVLFNLVTALPIGITVYGLFGAGRLFEYTISLIVTANLFLYFQNLSHAYYEQIKD